jgi:ElaB/YqjD/DUF883 family membrane-anchored ribosome-binding protein
MATTRMHAKRGGRSTVNNHHLADLREEAMSVGEGVKRMAETAGNVARHQLDPLEEYVRAKPIHSLLMAAGVGALLGLIFLRR